MPSSRGRKSHPKSLLLLHLLQIDERLDPFRRLLGPLNQNRPVFGDRQLAIEGRWLFAGFNVHSNIQFACRLSAEDSVGRRNISVIAADGGTNVSMVRYEVVGGIKAHPAQMRKQDSTHAWVASGVDRSWSSRLR